jgi:hypothetical protein
MVAQATGETRFFIISDMVSENQSSVSESALNFLSISPIVHTYIYELVRMWRHTLNPKYFLFLDSSTNYI